MGTQNFSTLCGVASTERQMSHERKWKSTAVDKTPQINGNLLTIAGDTNEFKKPLPGLIMLSFPIPVSHVPYWVCANSVIG